jgi:hypothetical protein
MNKDMSTPGSPEAIVALTACTLVEIEFGDWSQVSPLIDWMDAEDLNAARHLSDWRGTYAALHHPLHAAKIETKVRRMSETQTASTAMFTQHRKALDFTETDSLATRVHADTLANELANALDTAGLTIVPKETDGS